MIEVVKFPKRESWTELLKRPQLEVKNLNALVEEVFKGVEQEGDEALKAYTSRFDNVELNSTVVSKAELNDASSLLSGALKSAIQLAAGNIERFHKSQIMQEAKVETMAGVSCWRKSIGIEHVGLYIPGGTAPLFSTVLMLGIPARIANCKNVILCSPPDKNGSINPAILYAAKLVGITDVFKVGGIQAIAALAIGTDSVPRVSKIFGPGNQYVTSAKQFAQNYGVAIDMPAGPSELLVFADDSGEPDFIAADLLAQAEHGADSQVLLVTTDLELLQKTMISIQNQLKYTARKLICMAALSNSKAFLVEDEGIAINMINEYAPEHLIVVSKREDMFLNEVVNAGSVFLGNYTPESAGDYASGTNHTLPTNGYAKSYSGVSVDSFVRKITYQKITKEGLNNIGPAIELMAEAECLNAHKNAVTIRLKKDEV
ncbi:MAG: histidinol dehydrogenase [Parvicellaceae bacterium]|jgi:histidinol dehydrogenase